MNYLRLILYSSLFTLILCSCANFTIQKKRYSKGFYISKTNYNTGNLKSPELLRNKIKSDNKLNILNDTETTLVEKLDSLTSYTPICDNKKSNKIYTGKNKLNQIMNHPFDSKTINFNAFNALKDNQYVSKKFNNSLVNHKRNDFFSFWDNVVTGYYIVLTIIVIVVLIYYLFTLFPIATALLYASIILGVLLLLAGIGMLANNQF